MDGGVRSMLNADLAAGHTAVIVVSCFALSLPDGVSDPNVEALNTMLESEFATVRASGSVLDVVTPSAEFLGLTRWGTKMLDPALVSSTYQLGVRQVTDEALRLRRCLESLTAV